MAKEKKPKEPPAKYEEKVAIKGDFLEVFKVVKKHKEKKSDLEHKVDEINEKRVKKKP